MAIHKLSTPLTRERCSHVSIAGHHHDRHRNYSQAAMKLESWESAAVDRHGMEEEEVGDECRGSSEWLRIDPCV